MTVRRVRAKNADQAMKRAREKWTSRVVTKVNWLPDVPKNKKGEKLYSVVSHKRKVKRKKKGIAWV